MDLTFDIDPEEFQERKRRRISKMNAIPPPAPKVAPTSAPGIHEVAGFLPGRLEFEHELDNEAEDLVKDLEFGICLEWGGDAIPEDDQDVDVKARAKMLEEAKMRESTPGGKRLPNGFINGIVNGHRLASSTPKPESPPKTEDKDANLDEEADEPTLPPPLETKDSLQFKLTLLEMYSQRVDKRQEAKALIFNRGLLNYKQVFAISDTRGLIALIIGCRCKQMRRSGQKKTERFYIDYGPLRVCKLRKTMKLLQLTFYVCSLPLSFNLC